MIRLNTLPIVKGAFCLYSSYVGIKMGLRSLERIKCSILGSSSFSERVSNAFIKSVEGEFSITTFCFDTDTLDKRISNSIKGLRYLLTSFSILIISYIIYIESIRIDFENGMDEDAVFEKLAKTHDLLEEKREILQTGLHKICQINKGFWDEHLNTARACFRSGGDDEPSCNNFFIDRTYEFVQMIYWKNKIIEVYIDMNEKEARLKDVVSDYLRSIGQNVNYNCFSLYPYAEMNSGILCGIQDWISNISYSCQEACASYKKKSAPYSNIENPFQYVLECSEIQTKTLQAAPEIQEMERKELLIQIFGKNQSSVDFSTKFKKIKIEQIMRNTSFSQMEKFRSYKRAAMKDLKIKMQFDDFLTSNVDVLDSNGVLERLERRKYNEILIR